MHEIIDRPVPLPVRRADRPCRIAGWVPFDNSGALIGKAVVEFRNGLVISGVPVFRRNDGELSVGTPDVPLMTPTGEQQRDATGRRRYQKVISFATPEAKARWSQAIRAALADAGIAGATP